MVDNETNLDGAPPFATGEGFETALEHSWPWPAWATLALLLGLTLLVVSLYWRERGQAGRRLRGLLAALRLSLFGLAVWMLYGWMQFQHRTDLPDLVVLVDDSASMATVDRSDNASPERGAAKSSPGDDAGSGGAKRGGLTRLELARSLLADPQSGLLGRFSGRYRVKVFRFGRTARAVELSDDGAPGTMRDWEATEPATRLGQCVLDILQIQRGRPTAAILLLTDGVTTEGRPLREAATAAQRRQIPLYCVGIGSDQAPLDVRLSDLVTDDVAFVGDLLTFEVRLGASGYAGRSVRVRLLRADLGTVLADQTASLPADGKTVPVRLAFRPKEQGEFPFAIVAESLPGEATLENNRLTRTVTVSEETLSVLFVQAYPSYEYRFLKTLLQRQLKRVGGQERAVRLTTVLQEADPEYLSLDETAARTFPTSRDELFRYDVVIFGDVNPALLGSAALDNLAAFVTERGGGLIVCAGPRFTPVAYRESRLADLLPIELSSLTLPDPEVAIDAPFRPRLAPLGLAALPLQLEDSPDRNLKTWSELPAWYWLASAPDLRPGARLLVQHPTRTSPTGQPLPVVAVQFVGAGKVVVQLSDDSWRWSRSAEGETAYARYWMQWLRWLSRARLAGGDGTAQVTSDRERYESADPVQLRVRFLDERLAPSADGGVTLLVQREGAGPRTVTLQRDAVQRGVFATTLDPLADGVYRAWLVGPELAGLPPATRFAVVAAGGEQARLALDVPELKAAARASHGRYYALADASRLSDELPRGRQVRIESLPPEPYWNRWPVATIFVALITAEWLLRKRVGMM